MELLNFLQATNGAFKSDLMKSFVAKYKEDPSLHSPVVSGGGGGGGASLFSPQATPGASTDTTGTDTTDNANILFKGSRPDNLQTADTTTTTTASPQLIQQFEDNANTESNQNVIANRPTSATTTTTTTTSPTTTTTTTASGDTNANVGANVPDAGAVLEQLRGALSESRQLLLQQVTDATVEAHLSTCINTQAAVSQALARFRERRDSDQLPDLSKLSLSSGSMWEKMTQQMMPELAKAIQFSKILPGFSELCQDDQLQLVKQGTFEVMMARFCMLIDHEKETMLDPSHTIVCPRQVIQDMPMGQFLDGFFHMASRFNPLGLTDGELALFTAVLTFSPTRAGLKETKLVSLLHTLYQQALFTLFRHNHSEPENKFKQVLGLLPDFQRISEDHSKALMAMKKQSPESFNDQFPPMHKEMYCQD